MSDHRRLAEKIVERLFRNGQGEEADRLKMMMNDGTFKGRDLGGWSRVAATRQIEQVLSDAEGEGS